MWFSLPTLELLAEGVVFLEKYNSKGSSKRLQNIEDFINLWCTHHDRACHKGTEPSVREFHSRRSCHNTAPPG